MLFSMMPCRVEMLNQVAQGLKEGAPPLVGVHEGVFSSSILGDDYGIYYFIPKLSFLLGISTQSASYLFIGALFLIPSLFAFWVFWRAYPGRLERLISFLALVLCCYFSACMDLYVASHACVAVTLPFLLFTFKKQTFLPALVSLFSLGIFLGYADTIRLHAGGGGVFLVLSFLFMSSLFKKREKMALIGACLFGFLLPSFHFHYLINQRNQFLESQHVDAKSFVNMHPVWHSVYIGLSFLEDNPYHIRYADECADQKANSIQPGVRYLSKEYEEILKKECLNLTRTNFFFIAKTVFYKVIKLGEVFLVLGGVGLGLLLRFHHLPKEDLALYAIAIFFYALPGVLVLPLKAYTLGFRSASILLGAHSINEALSQKKVSFFKRKNPLPRSY